MPRIEQKLIEPGSDMERALAELRGRFVAKLGQPLQCEFEKFKEWLQAYVGAGGDLLGGCNIRAEALAPVLSKAGEKSGLLASMMRAPGKTIEQKWTAVEEALNKGRALVIEGRGTEISGDKSKFATFTSFHAFVLLQVIEDGEKKKWFIGFDPDVSATTETRDLWNSLIRAAFNTQDVELGKWNAQVKDLDRNALHGILTTMILGATASGFGPLVRRYAIDRTKGLEPPHRG
ncbi:hypothetical protein [Variovorax sp. JS1663]|uniref:hypothetical protein n=1 Tax=Variovorax sp. JS1663 TaxID=1851577 RepID=UPI000B346FB3|nr:hypothetical protein [Variovorax sp. JS1663]OUL98331.1 hypothetical protein A8M77_32040 [Variovorax sp. JS1663]